MKTLALILIAGIVIHETNSHAASKRGAREYEAKQYAEAAQSLNDAHRIAPSPQTAFNAATAEIAAGRHEQGSALMEGALRDPALRANAYFNRGNSALAANALDHAIRDYEDALRARPDFAEAKRNLEIALTRRNSQRQSQSGQQGGPGGQQQQQAQQQQQGPSQGQQKPEPKRGQADLEALLRSVQQQEQEELSRMKKLPADRRVGW